MIKADSFACGRASESGVSSAPVISSIIKAESKSSILLNLLENNFRSSIAHSEILYVTKLDNLIMNISQF